MTYTTRRSIAALSNASLSGSAKTDFVFGSVKKLLDTYSKEAVEVTSLAGVAAMVSLAAACGSKAHSTELVKAATDTLDNAKATVALKSVMLECLLASFSGEHAADAVPVIPAVAKAFRSAHGPLSTTVKHLSALFLLRVANAAPEVAADATDAKFGARLLDDRVSSDKFFRSARIMPRSTIEIIGRKSTCSWEYLLFTHLSYVDYVMSESTALTHFSCSPGSMGLLRPKWR